MRTLLLLLVGASLGAPGAAAASDISHYAEMQAWRAQYRRPAQIPFPAGNSLTPAKLRLGRLLFFDPILSGSKTKSCASCHNPGLSWTDGRQRAMGETLMSRRSPTLLNVAWTPRLGWDGHFRDLETVAAGPITSADVMNLPEAEMVARLAAIPGYAAAFRDVFRAGDITLVRIEAALATFERTIVSARAPFDRWLAGDETAISPQAKRGFALFNGKANCAACHSGWAFTDASFHDIGVGSDDDIGRGRLFPSSVKLRYAFKTPTLRDVARRAPYMHDGSLPTLDAVIALYDRGGVDRPSRADEIRPLGLSDADKSDLIAFLETLSGDPAPVSVPVLPR
jgi:cytochrome c peroxidase